MEKDAVNAIKDALDGLRESQAAAETALLAFQKQDLAKENARLRESVEQLSAKLDQSREETAELRRAYEELSKNFKHEISSKRISLLGLSEKQHRAYLKAGLEREHSRLYRMHYDLQNYITGMTNELYQLDASEREPLYTELRDLHGRINEQFRLSRERAEAARQRAADQQAEEFNQLRAAPIEDAALVAVRKFFAWETFLGLKIISVVGALLILLGIFTFGRFLYLNMGPVLQCIAIFAIGLALLGTGEAFYRKKWRGGFALALTACGSGVLFLGAALGYMTLEVLPVWAALGACVGISLLTFAAALRYNAQLIAIFALIGGTVLPSTVLTENLVFYAAIYFMILTLFVLLISTRKNWQVTKFIGLFSGMFAEVFLISYMYDVPAFAAVGTAIGLSYTAYLVIPVLGAWFTKTRIRAADIVLLSLNIFFRFILGMQWIETPPFFQIEAYIFSSVPAFIAVSCIVMALIAERKKHSGVPESEIGSLRALLFITSVTFTALTGLFALVETAWFSTGWLVQATGLALYGIYRDRRRFKIAGFVIGVISLLAFLISDVGQLYKHSEFVLQYSFITLAALIVSVAALKDKTESKNIKVLLDIFRCFAAVNLWGYVIYVLNSSATYVFTMYHFPAVTVFWLWKLFGSFAPQYAVLLSILTGFLLSILLLRIKRVNNKGFRAAAVITGTGSALWLIICNSISHFLLGEGSAYEVAAFIFLIALNIIAVCSIYVLLRYLCSIYKRLTKALPLLLSGLTVFMLTQHLVVHFSLQASSPVLTLIFGLAATGWIVFGFIKRNNVARISGLVLIFIAVFKLFVLDLHGLETVWRIVSYFTGGIVLLAISFTYQWFNKRLDANE